MATDETLISADVAQTVLSPREAWLAKRQTMLTASDAAAALGVNPYKSAVELWSEKTGLVEPPDLSGNEAVEFGIRLEPVICEAFAERTGRVVTPHAPYQVVPHPKDNLAWLGCTPDAIQSSGAREGIGNLQIKTAGGFMARHWTDGPPLHYQIQVQCELAVMGLDWGTLAVLIGGQRLRWFDVERNDRFIAVMIDKLAVFWQCVQDRTMPTVDGSLATTKALAKLHPNDDGSSVMLPADARQWADELAAAKADVKAAKSRERAAHNKLREAVGDATYGCLPDGGVLSLKTQTRKEHVVKESTFRVLQTVSSQKVISQALGEAQVAAIESEEFPSVAATKRLRSYKTEREWLLATTDARCKWCGCELTIHTATLDHIVPLAKGGLNQESNYCLACEGCNSTRADSGLDPKFLT